MLRRGFTLAAIATLCGCAPPAQPPAVSQVLVIVPAPTGSAVPALRPVPVTSTGLQGTDGGMSTDGPPSPRAP